MYGGGASMAAQHSDCPHPLVMNLGGMNVLIPATPADAKGLLKTAIRSNGPTVFFEGAALMATSGDVPEDDYTIPMGKARVVQSGEDVSLVTVGSGLRATLAAAKALASRSVKAEIVDVRSLVPLDTEAILHSVAKTGRLVIVDEARERCGAASEIAAVVAEHGFRYLRAPIQRVTTPNISLPYAPNAERCALPSEERIIQAATRVMSN
jgi:acetoin:2,6-dichlorophenolindophenol oxidoreductase subunit beta